MPGLDWALRAPAPEERRVLMCFSVGHLLAEGILQVSIVQATPVAEPMPPLEPADAVMDFVVACQGA